MSTKKRKPFLIPATLVCSTVAFCLYINRDQSGGGKFPVEDAIAKLELSIQQNKTVPKKALESSAADPARPTQPSWDASEFGPEIGFNPPILSPPTQGNPAQEPVAEKKPAPSGEVVAASEPDQFGWQKNIYFGKEQYSRVASLPLEASTQTLEIQTESRDSHNDFELDLNSPVSNSAPSEPTPSGRPISIFESTSRDNSSNDELEVSPNVDQQINQAIQRNGNPRSLELNQPQANRLPASNLNPQVAFPRIPDSVLQKAVHHIEYGKSLARRGSSFSARQEFFHGLRLMSQAADAQAGVTRHSDSLNEAIAAINEAEDFYARDSESQMTSSVETAIATHQTKAFPAEMAASMTPIEAMQRYFTFAQTKLVEAGGTNVVSSEALYCLGKLHAMLSKQPTADPLNIAKAIIYQRSALACDSNHFRSANELGTLLVRTGQLDDAKSLFQQSLRVQKMAVTWKNLATVHERLGERDMAQLANNEYQIALQQPGSPAVANNIQWMTPADFNAKAPIEIHENVAQQPSPPVAPAENKSSFGNLLKLF